MKNYQDYLNRKIQWILKGGIRVLNSTNIINSKEEELKKNISILNERFVITSSKNTKLYDMFVYCSKLSNILHNAANSLYRYQFFNDSDISNGNMHMKFYKEFKDEIFGSFGKLESQLSNFEIELRDIFRITPKCIRLGVIFDVSNNWFNFMKNCYDYYKKINQSIPYIPKIRKGKDRRCSFTIDPNKVKIIKNDKYIHPLYRDKNKSYKKTIYDYKSLLVLPEELGGYTIPCNIFNTNNISEIRVTPNRGNFNIDIKYIRNINLQKTHNKKEIYFKTKNRIIGIDFGVNNLMAIASNTGSKPLLIKGKRLASINNYYNYLLKISNNDEKIEKRRINIIHDILNKSVNYLINYIEVNRIGLVILGVNDALYNSFLSNNSNINKGIDYKYLIKIIKEKCRRIGTEVIEINEEYTSMTSIFNNQLPQLSFIKSGISDRISPRLYKTQYGIINCDINSAMNIILKYNPSAFDYIFNKNGFKETIDEINKLKLFNKEAIKIVYKNETKIISIDKKKNPTLTIHQLYEQLKSKFGLNANITITSTNKENVSFNAFQKKARKLVGIMVTPTIIC